MRLFCLAAVLLTAPALAQPPGTDSAAQRGTPRRSDRPAIVYARGPADPAAIARAWVEATAQPPLTEAAWQSRALRAELRLPGTR